MRKKGDYSGYSLIQLVEEVRNKCPALRNKSDQEVIRAVRGELSIDPAYEEAYTKTFLARKLLRPGKIELSGIA